MSEKTAGDFNHNDWVSILRESRWLHNLKSHLFAKFLGTEPKKLCNINQTFEKYYRNLIVTCFDTFLKENGYIKKDSFAVSEEDYYSLKYQNIEIEKNVFKRCPVEGIFFLEHADHKFIVELTEDYAGIKWDIEINHLREDESKAKFFLEKIVEYSKKHSYLKRAKVTPDLEHIPSDQKYTWDDLILPAELKDTLRSNICNLFDKLELYRKNKIVFKRGLILSGVPGTGKTLLGKILCSQIDAAFIWVTPKFLTDAKQVSNICTMARELSPSVLFLEDIDLYGTSRHQTADKSVLGELMNQLDGLIENQYVIVIATTNDEESMEKALKNRPGRFDRIIKIPEPDEVCRLKMLELFTKNLTLDGLDLKAIAKKTASFTGAHMKELVTTAVMNAMDKNSLDKDSNVILTKDHFSSSVISLVKAREFKSIGYTPSEVTDFDENED